jgi:hypothetical protein
MEQLFTYLVKSGGLLAVFYIAYYFLVRKETFFNSNRWFLLSGLLTSLLLPLYFIKKIIIVEPTLCPTTNVVHPAQQLPMVIPDVPVAEPFDWMQFMWVSYLLIAGIFVVRMLFNFTSLYRMLYKQQVIKREGFKFVNLNKNIAPFSFFNYIVYNPELYSEKEIQSILLHEKIHSREKHSADVILAELFCAIFWINPFAWLYKKAIIQNLEYIADQKATEQLEDKKSYQHALLKVVSNHNCLPITNNFYQSLIKKRIVMLNKNQSHRRSSWKYALVIPALIGFVFLFQVKTIAQDKSIEVLSDMASATYPMPEAATKDNENVPTVSRGEGNYVFDKISTDKELKGDAEEISASHDIKFVISNVKRNANGEIIAIKMTFDDKHGNTGKVEQNRTIPIRPIFFQIKQQNGKSIIGFYDNHEMVVKPADPVNENKITTVESISDDAIIYVDGDRYLKADLNELDPKGLEKIEVLTDLASLTKYGAKDKGKVYVITTNWTTREQNIALRQKESPSIITLTNGDEVVIYDKCNMKLPGYPSITFTDVAPVLKVDGIEYKNPRLMLERMNISKIKTIKVLDANDKESKASTIYKMIITTK